MQKKLILVFFVALFGSNICFGQFYGYIKDRQTGERLSNVSVLNLGSGAYGVSNAYGYFSIPASYRDSIGFSYVGYKEVTIGLNKAIFEAPYVLLLDESSTKLGEISVIGKKGQLFDDRNPNLARLSQEDIKRIPMILGERDPIRTLQFLPGVQEISEGSTSLSVRGGDADQNLLLLDEATVYNANHLFGFFSTFNADPIKQVEIYKGAFPAQYGGRLSSVIDVRMKEGDKKNYAVEGGIGLISSRLMVQGPIKKNKSSFLISGRRTYADLLLKPFQSEREKAGYYFGDINAKINFTLNPKNNLFISLYGGNDKLYENAKIPRSGRGYLINDTKLYWGNITFTGRWNSIYSSKLFQNLTFIYSKYRMGYSESRSQDYLDPPRFHETSLQSSIQDFGLKIDYDFYPSTQYRIKWGGELIRHYFEPRNFSQTASTENTSFQNNAESTKNLEGAAYVNVSGEHKSLFYQLGLRTSLYPSLKQVRLEPRLLAGTHLDENKSLSFSYARMNQYLHQISNTGNGLPTDVWIPSTENLNPSKADMISLSYTQQFKASWSASLTSYYKWISGNTAYKNGASFLGIAEGFSSEPFELEKSLLQGKAWNYGYELAIEKTSGRLTGFGGYTLAWSIAQFDELNSGKPFYNIQDRRHVLKMALAYRLSKRLSISSNFVFASGNALPLPSGVFFLEDSKYNSYIEAHTGVNGFRAENYHRLDIGLKLKTKKGRGSWDFGIYNVYNRKNPYNYRTKEIYDTENRTGKLSVRRSWLIPIIPSVTYNFKF